jgi:hypothetical protein
VTARDRFARAKSRSEAYSRLDPSSARREIWNCQLSFEYKVPEVIEDSRCVYPSAIEVQRQQVRCLHRLHTSVMPLKSEVHVPLCLEDEAFLGVDNLL